MELSYYPLERAVEKLGELTGKTDKAADLIHRGAWYKLPIHILTAPFFYVPVHVNARGVLDEYEHIPFYTAELSPQCLREWEAGNTDVEPTIVRKPYIDIDPNSVDFDDPAYLFKLAGPQDGYWHYTLKRKNVVYPSVEELTSWQQRGGDIDAIYPKPILLKECVMIIMADDLERLAQTINAPLVVDQEEPQLPIDQESIDTAAVQDIGKQLLTKYKDSPVLMTCRQAKKIPELQVYYDRYRYLGNQPVMVDKWLQEIGMPAGKPGRAFKEEASFIPSLD
jgi:hypothetical protein